MLTNIPTAYVGAAEGAKLLGISRSGFLKFVNCGRLPRPTRLGRRVLWDTSELLTALRDPGKRMGPSR
jgi:predicted DNA-binding transcriptional regulator AlpA